MAELFADEGAVEALFVLNDELAAPFPRQVNAPFVRFEMPDLKNAMAEEAGRQRVAENGAERFHQVERERPSAILGDVQEPESGIEAADVDGGDKVAVDQSVGVGQDGVDGILRRPNGSVFEGKLGWKEGRPRGIENSGRSPFQTAQFVEVRGGSESRAVATSFVRSCAARSVSLTAPCSPWRRERPSVPGTPPRVTSRALNPTRA